MAQVTAAYLQIIYNTAHGVAPDALSVNGVPIGTLTKTVDDPAGDVWEQTFSPIASVTDPAIAEIIEGITAALGSDAWMTGGGGSGGVSMLTSAGVPAGGLGSDGDACVNLATGYVYTKDAGVWSNTGYTLKGANGTNGAAMRSGSGVPGAGLGADGDTYLNQDTGLVYAKAGGAWSPTGASLKGASGISILSGSGAPDVGLGNDGDTYLDTDTGDVYAKAAGSWSPTGANLKGADGTGGGQILTCRLSALVNVDLASAPANFDNIAGVNGDLIFLNEQTAGAENGVWTFNGAGNAMTRPTAFDDDADVKPAMQIAIAEGDINNTKVFILQTVGPYTLGTTALDFRCVENDLADLIAAMGPPEVSVNDTTVEAITKRIDFLGSDFDVDSLGGNAVGVSAKKPIEAIVLACGAEDGVVDVAAGLVTFRLPYGFELTALPRASLTTAQAASGGGGILTVDVKQNSSSIFSTLLTIDNTAKTSNSAATPAVLSTTVLSDDDEITVDVTQVGDGSAAGLKVSLIGRRA